MYARAVTVQVQPGRIEEAIGIYGNSVVPAAKEQPGFKSCSLLVDRSTGKGISLILWETEADMQAGETSGYLREQIAKVAPTFAGPPSTERFEVAVQA